MNRRFFLKALAALAASLGLSRSRTVADDTGETEILIFNAPKDNDAAIVAQLRNADQVIGKVAIVCGRNAKEDFPAVEQVKLKDIAKRIPGLLRLEVRQSINQFGVYERHFSGRAESDWREQADGTLIYGISWFVARPQGFKQTRAEYYSEDGKVYTFKVTQTRILPCAEG